MEKSFQSIPLAQKIIKQGLIVAFLLSIIWFFKSLPGWIIENEMEKQLALIKPVREKEFQENGVREKPKAVHKAKEKAVKHISPISIDQIYSALKMIKDPEIDINVVDLGLIRDIKINEQGHITITMILTTRFCPYQGSLVKSVKQAVKKVSNRDTIKVFLNYSRTWSHSDLTEDGKKQWDRLFGNKSETI